MKQVYIRLLVLPCRTKTEDRLRSTGNTNKCVIIKFFNRTDALPKSGAGEIVLIKIPELNEAGLYSFAGAPLPNENRRSP